MRWKRWVRKFLTCWNSHFVAFKLAASWLRMKGGSETWWLRSLRWGNCPCSLSDVFSANPKKLTCGTPPTLCAWDDSRIPVVCATPIQSVIIMVPPNGLNWTGFVALGRIFTWAGLKVDPTRKSGLFGFRTNEPTPPSFFHKILSPAKTSFRCSALRYGFEWMVYSRRFVLVASCEKLSSFVGSILSSAGFRGYKGQAFQKEIWRRAHLVCYHDFREPRNHSLHYSTQKHWFLLQENAQN